MIKKTTSEYGQTVTTSDKPEKYRSRLLSIRAEDGSFIATLAQSYTGTVTLCSGQGVQLVEDEN